MKIGGSCREKGKYRYLQKYKIFKGRREKGNENQRTLGCCSLADIEEIEQGEEIQGFFLFLLVKEEIQVVGDTKRRGW